MGRKNLFIKIDNFFQLYKYNFKLVKIKVICWRFQLMTLI